MSDKEKSKKLRLYKYAAEVNIATETLLEFLQQKGHDAKTHMTILTDEMLADISAHFKKDIEKAEKHYRKISEFQKKRGEKAEPDSKIEETVKEHEELVEKSDEQETEPVERIAEPVEVDEQMMEENVETQVTELAEKIVEEVAAEPEHEEIAADHVIATPSEEVVEKEVKYRTKSEIEIEERRKGLKIVGKMDIHKPKEAPKETKKTADEKDTSAGKKPESESEDEKGKKKKKKKVLKSKKKTGTEEGEEVVKNKKKKKVKKLEVDKKEVEAAIKRTMLSMDESALGERASFRKKKRKEKLEIQERLEEEKMKDSKKIVVTEFIAVNELANLMNVTVSDVIQKCIGLGLMVTINQRLDLETITLVADEFDFEVEIAEEYTSEALEDFEDESEELKYRPPVVTIMGHVDHGKTSLLDYIRSSNVVAGESGGITQHIGAYRVVLDNGKSITFLDTPGHEAFTAMRARGASITDIVILVIAADDAVMPQTVEAINHARAANVPIIIAINKVDKPGANIEKIKKQLADRNILVEDWGGKYQCVEISAKKGLNIDLLLEKVLLEADLLELTANPDRNARGAIIESQLDKGRGVTATVLVQKGTLQIGDIFIAGNYHGRVRAMFDERNQKMEEAGPSTPALVLGFESSPQAGDTFVVVDTEREARETSVKRLQLKREQDYRQVRLVTLDEIANQIGKGSFKELKIIVKGDVDGSVEALSDSLMKLSNQEISVRVIHKAVGAISEGDVLLAAASEAIIIGFHVRPNSNARKLAEVEKIDIRLYSVIYDAINEVKSALEGMLEPVLSEELNATVEVRDTFKVPKVGTIAGCYVQSGKVGRSNKVRLFREGVIVFDGEISTLKRFKDDVREVDAGYECGISIHNFNDIKVGDIIEAYHIVQTKKKLL